MILGYNNDGNEYKYEEIDKLSLKLNKQRDLLYFNDKNSIPNANFNFVGFISNKKDNLYIVFPKGYSVDNIDDDAKILFSTIQKFRVNNPDTFIGDMYGENYSSNYPFAAFWGVYEYYQKYGLYHEVVENINKNSGNKVNWKETLKKTKFYLLNNDVVFFPLFYSKKTLLSNFITECMIFVINYTIDKFSCLLDMEPIETKCSNFDFIKNKEQVINTLIEFKSKTFKDNLLYLLDNLIKFFQQLNQGGSYYFKNYTFEYIWEDMVRRYLSEKFIGIKNGEFLISDSNKRKIQFKKITFHPNLANKSHSIQPDLYCIQDDVQYIFDAKYKKNITGIDYKQLCYILILKDQKDEETKINKATTSYSALLIPDSSTHNKLHFKIDPIFNNNIQDIEIFEQYLDIKKIMKWYIEH